MIYYLCSLPFDEKGRLSEKNKFALNLRNSLTNSDNYLFIASDPTNYEFTNKFALEIKNLFESAGVFFKKMNILDDRNSSKAKELINEANFIVLSGGHVPTQIKFFEKIGLRNKLKKFNGVLLGISAGSMNAAEMVYSQPELEGESIDINYKRFFKGLGITKINILPHYNQLVGSKLDGKLLYEEITSSDSINHKFYIFNDGTYLSNVTGKEVIYGDCFLLEDKKMIKVCSDNKELIIA